MNAGMRDLVYEMAPHKVATEQLVADPGDFLWCTSANRPTSRVLDHVGPDRVVPVWSMWRGYRERDTFVRDWRERNSVEPRFIHSGGHAAPQDLEQLAAAVRARETIMVHTERGCAALARVR